MNDFPFGAGLGRDQRRAEHRLGSAGDLGIGAAEFDAAGLAAPARMNLRLDRPVPAAELGGHIHRLLGTIGDPARGHGDAEPGQKFLGLILVDVHVLVIRYPYCGRYYLYPIVLMPYAIAHARTQSRTPVRGARAPLR